MSSTITFNGVSYSVPATGDENWSDSLTLYLIAIASGALQKTGGTFTLTAETDFGATYGIKSAYVKSRGTNPSATGILRLANAEAVSWRNAANSGDLALKVNASDWLQYNSIDLVDKSTAQTLTNKTLSGASNTFSNIPYSALTLATSIVNGDISGSAAIALSKLAALTTGKVLQSNASTGAIEASSITNTTLGYLDATSSVQTQLDAKIAKSVLTTKGDLFVATASATIARQGVGSDGQVLVADSGQTNGINWATPASAPSSSAEISNLTLATSVGSSALTIAVKTQAGNDASGGDVIKVGMRSSTLTSGIYNQRTITAALSLVISSGSTLGQTSAKAARLFIYLLDNSGTLELAVSQTLYSENNLISTTAEGGAGAADSGSVVYSTTARTSVPFRLVGILDNTQTTAGTWTSAGTNLHVCSYADANEEDVNAAYNNTSAQSLNNSSQTTITNWTSVFDTHTAFAASTGIYTVPISGKYSVYSKVNFAASSTGGRQLYAVQAGSASITYNGPTTYGNASITGHCAIQATFRCLAGDTITIQGFQSSGGALALTSTASDNYVNIERIGNY